MKKGTFGVVVTAAAIVAMAAMWWNGWIVGQTRAVAADAPAAAADVETFTVFRINTPGDYVIQNGVLVRYGSIPTPPVPPEPPTPPDVDELTARAKTIKEAAKKATSDPQRETTALQLAELYRQIGKKIEAKEITGQELIQLAVKFGTDQLLNGKGTEVVKAWQPTRDVISAEAAKVLNAGGSDADFVKLLNEVAAGIQASAPNAEPQIDIEMIVAIIRLIMELIALIS